MIVAREPVSIAIAEEPPLLLLIVLANHCPVYVTLLLFCSMRVVAPADAAGVETGVETGVDVGGGVVVEDVGGGVVVEEVGGGVVVEPVLPVFVVPELPRSIMYASPYSVG